MRRRLAAGLVTLQLLLLLALVVEPRGALWPVGILIIVAASVLGLVGLVVAVWGLIGLGPALTASPIPREHAALVTHGIYGVMRNPIYTGLLIGGLGLALLGASWWHGATWFALTVLLVLKGRWEERMLASRHPEFAIYAQKVGRYLPGIGRWRSTGN